MALKPTAFEWDKYEKRVPILHAMRDSMSYMDAVLVSSDGVNIPIHVVVVSCLGKTFTQEMMRQMDDPQVQMTKLMTGAEVKVIEVKDVKGQTLKAMVDYCYAGDLQTGPKSVWDVLEAAEKYQMHHLVSSCCSYVAKFISFDNCIPMYHLGSKKNHPELKASGLNTISHHFQKVVQKSFFFSTLPLEDLSHLLSNDELNVPYEAYVWVAIQNWVSADFDKRKDHLKDLLTHLRFHRTPDAYLQLLKDNFLIASPCFKGKLQEFVQQMIDEKASSDFPKDGFNLPAGLSPVTIRPRIPYSLMLSIGGWVSGSTSGMMETYDSSTNTWHTYQIRNPKERAYHGLQYHNGLLYMIGKDSFCHVAQALTC